MTRVATFGNYQSALLDLMSAQNRAAEAQERVSTQRIASDLTGFGRGSETLTALKAMQSRIQGFQTAGETVAARLTSQDLAFERIANGAGGARDAIAGALAAGRVDGLMLELENQFQIAQNGLNAQHQGRYLFAGGNVEQAPVDVMTLSELSGTTVAAMFRNDTLKQVSRVDEGTSLETGFLASELGSELFEIFREIQVFHEATPITGRPDETTRQFLAGLLSRLDGARQSVVDQAARNGSMQNRVETILDAQERQQISLKEMLGDRTDADMAKAITDLQLSQVAIQASVQVINQLRQTSLLNVLS